MGVLFFLIFSFTATLLWKCDLIDQKFDRTGQTLEGIHTWLKRQHEENNLVMSSNYLCYVLDDSY